MADRLAALGGRLEGTTITGTSPTAAAAISARQSPLAPTAAPPCCKGGRREHITDPPRRPPIGYNQALISRADSARGGTQITAIRHRTGANGEAV